MNLETEDFSYHLIRNELLQDLLGKDHDAILYWLGKSLARKYPLESVDELIAFFEKANWGQLQLVKEKRQAKLFELTGPWMGKHDSRCYQLEAGFLTQYLEQSLQRIAAGSYSASKKAVLFTIEFDRHDAIAANN